MRRCALLATHIMQTTRKAISKPLGKETCAMACLMVARSLMRGAGAAEPNEPLREALDMIAALDSEGHPRIYPLDDATKP